LDKRCCRQGIQVWFTFRVLSLRPWRTMWYLEPVFGRIEPLRQRDNQRKIKDDAVLSACFWLLGTTSVAGPSVKQLFCLIFFLLFPSLLRSVWCFRSTSVFLCFYFFLGCCHVSCHFNPFARKVRLHKTLFAEPKKPNRPKTSVYPWHWQSRQSQSSVVAQLVKGFLRLEAAGGLFIECLPMGWGVLHILVSVAILVSLCSLCA